MKRSTINNDERIKKCSGKIQAPGTSLSPEKFLVEGVHCLQIDNIVQIPAAIATTAGLPTSVLTDCRYDAPLEGMCIHS